MVISDEIKFPRPVRIDPYRTEKKIDPIVGASPVLRIGAFKREWHRAREERRQGGRGPLPSGDEISLRRLIEGVNAHLERQNILIHLVLKKDENGYAIDVYDCSYNDCCTVVGDVVIDLDDLPELLIRLEQEAGILLDTVS